MLSIDVVHSLHCLNQLRKVLYREYYFPNQKPKDFFYTHMSEQPSQSQLCSAFFLYIFFSSL